MGLICTDELLSIYECVALSEINVKVLNRISVGLCFGSIWGFQLLYRLHSDHFDTSEKLGDHCDRDTTVLNALIE